jgi:beta-N-acetylhexosaminidase
MGSTLSRRQLLVGAGLAATATAAGCGSHQGPGAQSLTPTSSPARPGSSATAGGQLDENALRRKVASLLVVGFRGQSVQSGDWIVRAINDQQIGGVILFDTDQLTAKPRNITSRAQVTNLIKDLRAAARSPLIVSLDQEGGKISRLNPGNGFPASQSEAEVGAVNQKPHTVAWAKGLVDSMKSIGVTMNYAPVVDLNVNPNNPAIGQLGRSFSADADVVVANASQEIQVHRSARIKTSIKHFPGFGSATGNTDFDVVDVSNTWHRSELEPFQRLITSGDADSVLVAHLLNRQLDPNSPMSLSHSVVTDLLRGQLGWKGPVVSDDMQAAGITARFGVEEAFTLAVQAGVDLLVYANQQVFDPEIVDRILDTAVQRVKSGALTVAQIDAAVAQVDKLRP